MRSRNTKENINQLREEIKELYAVNGVKKTSASVTQLSKTCQKLVETLDGTIEEDKMQHIVLNNFVDVYKDMLCLTNKES